MTERKRKPKADGPRTEVFAMRLDPKLKYLAEIAARKQRRSLASFVEWAIEQACGGVMLTDKSAASHQTPVSVKNEENNLWDIEPSDRFLKLATRYPELLTYEEQIIWKAIQQIALPQRIQTEEGWKEYTRHSFLSDEGAVQKPDPYFVRRCWGALVSFAEGSASEQDVKDALHKVRS